MSIHIQTAAKQRVRRRIDWSSAGILLVLAFMIILFSSINSAFSTPRNIGNILRQASIIGVCAVGMTAVVLTGGIDLSVGSVIGLSAVLSAMMISSGVPIWVATIVVLFVGAAAGLFNAACVTAIGIPPLVTTLGTWTALRGLVYIITGGRSVYGIPDSFRFIGQGNWGLMPISAIFMIVMFVIGYIILEKTVFGRRIYSIGGNAEAARLSGIRVKWELIKVYTISGILAAGSGLILMSRVNSGQPSAGVGYELNVVTAVLLGGVSVSGGEGRLYKVIIGVMFMGVLSNGMLMLNVGEYQQQFVRGLVLLVAVSVDILSKRYNDSGRAKRSATAKDSGQDELREES